MQVTNNNCKDLMDLNCFTRMKLNYDYVQGIISNKCAMIK